MTLDLDDITECPLAGQCETCGTADDLDVVTVDTTVGVYCVTICGRCLAAAEFGRVSCHEAALRVLEHCEHLGCDLDEMADALNPHPSRAVLVGGGVVDVSVTTTFVELWDGRQVPGTRRGDLLVFGFRHAPAGLATYRQLRAMGKRPGGQDLTGVIEWRQGRRWAGLYRIDLAVPVRPMTPARTEALSRAMTARRTCRNCHRDAGFCLPRTIRQCWPCHQSAGSTEFVSAGR